MQRQLGGDLETARGAVARAQPPACGQGPLAHADQTVTRTGSRGGSIGGLTVAVIGHRDGQPVAGVGQPDLGLWSMTGATVRSG